MNLLILGDVVGATGKKILQEKLASYEIQPMLKITKANKYIFRQRM